MQDRLEGVVARLEAGEEADGAPLDLRRIARELFPVAHLFESTGFMSIGKEIAHIERSLMDLAPDSDTNEVSSSQPSQRGFASSSASKQTVEPTPEPWDEEKDVEAMSVPLPVVVGLFLLVLAAAGASAIIFGIGPFARRRPPLSTQAPSKTAEPTAIAQPTPSPVPSPTPAWGAEPTAIPRGVLAAEVAFARLALAKGDLETAATHLSEAARIDRSEPDLKEIAEQIVRGLIGWAAAAADNAEWETAGSHLERAERTAMRFGVKTAQIESERARIAAMERFVVVGPGDRQTVLRSIGRRVEVALADGATRTGRIEGIDASDLVLNVDSRVGGGAVRFTEEIPLSTIRSLKIFEN